MDRSYFNSRNLAEKMHLIVLHAEYLNVIDRSKYRIKLYAYEYSYVEVYHNQQSQAIEKIEILHPKNTRLNLFAVAVNLCDLYRKERE